MSFSFLIYTFIYEQKYPPSATTLHFEFYAEPGPEVKLERKVNAKTFLCNNSISCNVVWMAYIRPNLFWISLQQASSNTLHYIHIEQLDKVMSCSSCQYQLSRLIILIVYDLIHDRASLRFQRAHRRSWNLWRWCIISQKTSRLYCSHTFDWPMVSQITRGGCRLCRPDCMQSLFWVRWSFF